MADRPDATLEVHDGEHTDTLTRPQVTEKILRRELGLWAVARTTGSNGEFTQLKDLGFGTVLPDVRFDPMKGPNLTRMYVLVSSETKRLVDLNQTVRQRPDTQKVSLFVTGLTDTPTFGQGAPLQRVHAGFYASCIGALDATPSERTHFYLIAFNFTHDPYTCTFMITGAEVVDNQKGLVQIELSPGCWDFKTVDIIAPASPGKKKIYIRTESKRRVILKALAQAGEQIALGAAMGAATGTNPVVVGNIGGWFQFNWKLNVHKTDESNSLTELANQIQSSLQSYLSANKVSGVRTKYGDIVPINTVVETFNQQLRTGLILSSMKSWGDNPTVLADKLLSRLLDHEYATIKPTCLVQEPSA